jgi:hypothetical protein
MTISIDIAGTRVEYEQRTIASADPVTTQLFDIRKGDLTVEVFECWDCWRVTTNHTRAECRFTKVASINRILRRLDLPAIEQIEEDLRRYMEDMSEDPMGTPEQYR